MLRIHPYGLTSVVPFLVSSYILLYKLYTQYMAEAENPIPKSGWNKEAEQYPHPNLEPFYSIASRV